jgi:phosphoribosylformylglycinamidine synthase
VQVADPFMEKLLLEATLELIRSGHLVGIQDMGAAGLTSSSVEMAFRGEAGIEIDTAKVPQRETGMVPYEICLSESQERMLLVAKKGREKSVEAILKKWNLHATVIGRVTGDGRHRVLHEGRVVSDIPVAPLADDKHPFFPVARRPQKRPKYLNHAQKLDLKNLHQPHDMGEALLRLLASPTIAHKGWIFRQYDHMVRTNTLQLPGSDAAVVRVKENGRALAMSVDGNGRYCYLDPYTGGKIAVAEAARNVAVSGAVPLACTDCLNFGNPEDPEIMWQLAEAVRGMAEACRELEVPVIGGNVSLYNQSPQRAIDPTPIVGVVGLLEPVGKGSEKSLKPVGQAFKRAGDIILLAGKDLEELGGSEYLATIHKRKAGKPPKMDLHLEKRVYQLCAQAAAEELLSSAHDLSDGGLAVALAESCLGGGELDGPGLGCTVELPQPKRWDAALFGESQSRVLFSCSSANAAKLEKIAQELHVPLARIGETGGRRLVIEHRPVSRQQVLNLSLEELETAWKGAFAMMEGSYAS